MQSCLTLELASSHELRGRSLAVDAGAAGPRASMEIQRHRDFFGPVQGAVAANLDQIRRLEVQALSEGILRYALVKLDLWRLQRKFSLLQLGLDWHQSVAHLHSCVGLPMAV